MPTLIDFNDLAADFEDDDVEEELAAATRPTQTSRHAATGGTRGANEGGDIDAPGGGVAFGASGGVGSGEGTIYSIVSVLAGGDLCRARIGGGSTFCLKNEDDCKIKSHVTGMDKLKDDDMYYVMKSATVGFCEPCISAEWVLPDLLEEWTSAQFSANEWSARFGAANRSQKGASKAEMDRAMEDQRKAKAYQTPKKVKNPKGAVSIAFDSDYSPFKAHFDQAKEGIVLDGPTLSAGIVDLGKGLESTAQRTEVISSFVQEGLNNSLLASQMIEQKVVTVESQLGNPVRMPKELDAPTLWGILGLLGDKLVVISDNGTAQEEVKRDLLNRVTQMEDQDLMSLINIKAKENSSFQIQVFNALRAARARIGRQDATIKSIQEQLATLSVDHLRGTDLQFTGALATDTSGPSLARLEALEGRLLRLENDQDETTVKFSKLGLSGIDETHAWVKMSFPSRRYGLVIDVYTLCERMYGDSESDQASMLNLLDKQMKLKLFTGAEALAVSSLRHPIPRLFHSASSAAFGDGRGNESFFSRLPNYKSWSNASHGMKQFIVKRMTIVRSSLQKEINNCFKSGTLAYQVSVDALSRSVTWMTLFIGFVDRTYEQLHIHSGFPESKAWGATTQLGYRVWSDMGSLRDGAFLALRTEDEVSTCGSVLWTIFKTHDKMEEFAVANIDDHSSISSEYVKFLASNSGEQGDVSGLAEEVKLLKSTVKSQGIQMSSLSKKNDTASNGHDRTKTLINGFETRLNRVEKKTS